MIIHENGIEYRFRITHVPIDVYITDGRDTFSDIIRINPHLIRRVDVVSGVGGADFVRVLWLEPVQAP
jgi:hypothetical protein